MANVHHVENKLAIKQEVIDLEFCSSKLQNNGNILDNITQQELHYLKDKADFPIDNILIADSGGLIKYEVPPEAPELTEIMGPESSTNLCHERSRQDDCIHQNPNSTTSSEDLAAQTSTSNQVLVCEICSFVADTKKGFKMHQKAMHERGRVRCPKCGLMVTKSGIGSHLKRHNATGLKSCSKCNFKGSPGQLWKHRLQHHAFQSYRKYYKRYYCSVCKVRFFKHKFELENHVKRHYNTTNYCCKQCQSFFHNVWSLEYHISRRLCKGSEENSLICQHCSRTFRTKLYYDFHLRTKHKSLLSYEELAKPILGLTCPVESCQKIFYYRQALCGHKARHHKSWQPCSYCQQIFPAWALKAHVRKKHPKILAEEKKQGRKIHIFGCNKCSASFEKEIEYDLHALSHSFSSAPSARNRACQGTQRTQIKKESAVDTGSGMDVLVIKIPEKPFSGPDQLNSIELENGESIPCDQNKQVGSNMTAKAEMNESSSKSAEYSCKYCLKHFTRKCSQLKHERNGVCMRPAKTKETVKYSCDVCSRSFSRKSSLQLHIKTTSCGKNTLGPCPGCQEQFDNIHVLKKHMRYCVHL